MKNCTGLSGENDTRGFLFIIKYTEKNMNLTDLIFFVLIIFLILLCYYYGKQYLLSLPSNKEMRGYATNRLSTLRFGVWRILRNAATFILPGGEAMEMKIAAT